MQYASLLLILCLLACDSRGDDNDTKDASTEQKTSEQIKFQFDGVWKPKGAMLGGVLLTPPALNAITLRIDDGKYEVSIEGEERSDKGTFTLDENAAPKRMTIKSTSGPNQGKTFLAIYEIKAEDAMRVCYDLSGKEFPKEFKAPKDTSLYLVGYRRQASPSTNPAEALNQNEEQTIPDFQGR